MVDSGNNRVLEYFSPLTTDTRADRVFGQDGSFTTDGCDQNGLDSAGLCLSGGLVGFGSAKVATAKMRLQDDGGAALDPAGNLYVADSGNNRVLIFLGATPTPTPRAAPTSTPTPTPTTKPSATPTAKPSATPTAKPTPTASGKPSATATAISSVSRDLKATATPTPATTLATPKRARLRRLLRRLLEELRR